MQGLAIVLGLMVGFVLWGILLVFLAGNPFGRTGLFDILLILGPIFGVVLPGALHLLAAERPVATTWLVALAPLAGFLNVGICFFIAWVTGIAPDASSLPSILATLIWIPPSALLFRKLGADAAERS